MRRSFDALALAVRERLDLDPESGALFVFASKRDTRVKVIWFDRNGYCILYKRLHQAHFEIPDATDTKRPMTMINARALAVILRGERSRAELAESLEASKEQDMSLPAIMDISSLMHVSFMTICIEVAMSGDVTARAVC